MWIVRRGLGLFLFGIVLVLLGEPVATAYCPNCRRPIPAMCKPHLNELAGKP